MKGTAKLAFIFLVMLMLIALDIYLGVRFLQLSPKKTLVGSYTPTPSVVVRQRDITDNLPREIKLRGNEFVFPDNAAPIFSSEVITPRGTIGWVLGIIQPFFRGIEKNSDGTYVVTAIYKDAAGKARSIKMFAGGMLNGQTINLHFDANIVTPEEMQNKLKLNQQFQVAYISEFPEERIINGECPTLCQLYDLAKTQAEKIKQFEANKDADSNLLLPAVYYSAQLYNL